MKVIVIMTENDGESSDNPESDEEDENKELFGLKHSCHLNELRRGSKGPPPPPRSASMTPDQSS